MPFRSSQKQGQIISMRTRSLHGNAFLVVNNIIFRFKAQASVLFSQICGTCSEVAVSEFQTNLEVSVLKIITGDKILSIDLELVSTIGSIPNMSNAVHNFCICLSLTSL